MHNNLACSAFHVLYDFINLAY